MNTEKIQSTKELEKKFKELLDSDKKSEKYFYNDIQSFAREVETFYYHNKNKYKESAELIIKTYENLLLFVKSDEYGYKSAKDETTRIFLEIAGFGIGKNIEIQKYFLEKFKCEIGNDNLTELIVKALDKYLDLQGTETSLSDDGKSIDIKSFYINLNENVRKIRKEVLDLLLNTAQNNRDNYKIISQIISAINNNIRSLAVILQNDKSETGQEIVKEEIDISIKILKPIKKLYDGSKIEHLNIFHEILLAVWDPYEDDLEIKKMEVAEQLKGEIWSNPKYMLFKAILRPGFKFTENIPKIAAEFSEDNIELLEEIIQFAENEKSIYNSIKTFFYHLGEKNENVFAKIIEKVQSDNDSPLWYYIGFGFADAKKALDFGGAVAPDNIVKIKATIDVFYHVGYKPDNTKSDWHKQSPKTKKTVYNFLSKQIKLGTELIKKDQKEIFWWSSSTANTAQYIFDKKYTKESLKIFELILDDFSENEPYSNYLFNSVSSAIFGLRENKGAEFEQGIAKILKKFEKVGEISQSMEMLFEVVARVNALLLIDFYRKRFSLKLKTNEFKRIPFNNQFVFSKVKGLKPDKIDAILESIANLGNSDKGEFRYAPISRLFVDFAESINVDYTIDWLKDKYLNQTSDESKVINAVRLLEDFDDYSNEKFWDFLKWVLEKFDSRKVRSAVLVTEVSGSVDVGRIVQKEKFLNEWLKSDNGNVKSFAENELKRLRQERKEWLNE